MAKTKIEWADEVWNPVTGCTKVSQGCKNCYAERIYERFHPGQKFTDVHMIPGRLDDPLRWRKPRRVFVNSMSDLFHEAVLDGFITQVFWMFSKARQHNYLVLTKRPERMLSYLKEYSLDWVFPVANVWLGVSCEDQKAADERIPLLLQTPAAVRFVSVEPMLGPVDITPYLADHSWDHGVPGGLSWVICGGESGPHARPMHPDWARGLRDQCQVAGVPFFFKQWGEWTAEYPSDLSLASRAMTFEHGMTFYRVGKSKAGRVLDERTYEESPA